MNVRQTLLAIGLLAVATTAVGWWLGYRPLSRSAAAPVPLEAHIAALSGSDDVNQELLAVVTRLEAALKAQIARTESLAREVEALKARQQAADVDGSATASDGAAEAGVAATDGQALERAAFLGGRRGARVSIERLVEAGMHPSDAAEIVAAVDEIALERLNLRFEAVRNGTANTADFRERMAALPDTREFIEETYGDDAYDRYLYASGRPNRVVVSEVMHGSAAERVGLEPGDVLFALDDQRIYSTRDILTIASRKSGNVPLAVRRNGQLVQVYVEAGPLGIRAQRTVELPGSDGG